MRFNSFFKGGLFESPFLFFLWIKQSHTDLLQASKGKDEFNKK